MRVWAIWMRKPGSHHTVKNLVRELSESGEIPSVTSEWLHEPPVFVVEKSEWDKRDFEAKKFCEVYNKALDTIVELKKRLGEDPGDY